MRKPATRQLYWRRKLSRTPTTQQCGAIRPGISACNSSQDNISQWSHLIPFLNSYLLLAPTAPCCTKAQGEGPPPSTCPENITCCLVLVLSGSWGTGYRWKVIILCCLLTCHSQLTHLNNIPAPGQTHFFQGAEIQPLSSHLAQKLFHTKLYTKPHAIEKIQKLICYWQNKCWETWTQIFLKVQCYLLWKAPQAHLAAFLHG